MENNRQNNGPEIPNFLREVQKEKKVSKEEQIREEVMKELVSKPVKITKVGKPIPKKYITINISTKKLKKALATILMISLASVAGILMYNGGKFIYQGYKAEQQKQAEIKEMIENDYYLKDIVIYTNDSTPETELRKKTTRNEMYIEELISHKEVGEYIIENYSEEDEEKLLAYFGIDEKDLIKEEGRGVSRK